MASLRNWMQKVSDDSDEAITEFRQAVHQATAFFTHGLSSLTSGAEWRPWHCVAGGRHAAAAGAARGAAPAGDQVACGARGFLQRGNQDAGRVPRPPRVGRAGPEAPRGAGRLQRAGISRHGCRLWEGAALPKARQGLLAREAAGEREALQRFEQHLSDLRAESGCLAEETRAQLAELLAAGACAAEAAEEGRGGAHGPGAGASRRTRLSRSPGRSPNSSCRSSRRPPPWAPGSSRRWPGRSGARSPSFGADTRRSSTHSPSFRAGMRSSARGWRGSSR